MQITFARRAVRMFEFHTLRISGEAYWALIRKSDVNRGGKIPGVYCKLGEGRFTKERWVGMFSLYYQLFVFQPWETGVDLGPIPETAQPL